MSIELRVPHAPPLDGVTVPLRTLSPRSPAPAAPFRCSARCAAAATAANAPLGTESIPARTAAIIGTAGRSGGHSLRVGQCPRSRRCRRQHRRAATGRRLAFTLHTRGLHQARSRRPGSGMCQEFHATRALTSGVPCCHILIICSMPMPDRDPGLDTLLDLHGQTLFVDEAGTLGEVHRVSNQRDCRTPARTQLFADAARFRTANGWWGSIMRTRSDADEDREAGATGSATIGIACGRSGPMSTGMRSRFLKTSGTKWTAF